MIRILACSLIVALISGCGAGDEAPQALAVDPPASPASTVKAAQPDSERAVEGVDDDAVFSMKIMDVFSIKDRGMVLTGRVATGSLSIGDTVCVPLDSGETVARPVEGIEQFRKLLERAEAGQNVGIMVSGIDHKAIVKGGQLVDDCDA